MWNKTTKNNAQTATMSADELKPLTITMNDNQTTSTSAVEPKPKESSST